MDLRPRKKQIQFISGFTQAEVEKMENLLNESREQVCDAEICKKLAKMFTRSKGRAGKPIVKWTEVQAWFRNRLACDLSKDNSAEANQKLPDITEGCSLNKANESSHIPKEMYKYSADKHFAGQKDPVLSDLEFEARSSKDGAWYDIDTFFSHRFLNTEQPEALVRFVGFEPGEDEWVNVRKAIRERSVALEDSECNKVRVGDLILCFQEGKNQAKYLEAHVIEIQKRFHDIRGCRCLFGIRYTCDDTKETVRLRRLCVRPSILGRP
ncbi:protein SAWADEE HOMEODOMAIN 1 isoform X1 [Capsicum chacoense]